MDVQTNLQTVANQKQPVPRKEKSHHRYDREVTDKMRGIEKGPDQV